MKRHWIKYTCMFSEIVNKFKRLHDVSRRQNESSYYRFLTNYIGVKNDGSLSEDEKRKNCLRAELLGYLAFGEIIKGGKCFGCSSCLLHAKFHDYSIEQKRAVIDKLSSILLELIDCFSDLPTQLSEEALKVCWYFHSNKLVNCIYLETDEDGYTEAEYLSRNDYPRGIYGMEVPDMCALVSQEFTLE